jgi:hypothetical protein
MTAPSYTTDLTDIATGDETADWEEFTGNSYDGQGPPAYGDNEYPYIQGSYAVTQDTTKSTKIGSLGYPTGTLTWYSGYAFFVWQNYSSPFAMGTYAQGGMRVVAGSGLGDFYAWYVGGSDKPPMPYGGWQCHVVEPTWTPSTLADDTAGTPDGYNWAYVGAAVYVLSGPSKGEPHQVDAIRYGRGRSIFEYGDLSNGYCTIPGFAAVNDLQANRWGLIQAVSGGYLFKGEMYLGNATNPVDFRDSDRIIFIQWTPKVTATWNLISVNNASSYVSMTGFQFIVVDTTTGSRGSFYVYDSAEVYLDSCTFNDMYVFGFSANTDVIDCTFRRCNSITQGSATFDGCLIARLVNSGGMSVDDIGLISNCEFISDGTGHAMTLSSAHAGNEYTFSGNTFTGYASVSGSTGNEAIYNNSGGLVTINITDGGDTPSIRNGTNAQTILNNAVTLTLTGIVSGSEVRIYSHGTTTELDGIENVDTLDDTGETYKFEYTYNYAASTYIDIVIVNINYIYYRINNLLLSATSSSIPISQQFDRNYSNP